MHYNTSNIIKSTGKHVIVKKNKDFKEELKKLRIFMKEKKISQEALSKEMGYSIAHVNKVFNGLLPVSEKFMKNVLRSLKSLLQRDLRDFYTFLGGEIWVTSKLGSLRCKELF